MTDQEMDLIRRKTDVCVDINSLKSKAIHHANRVFDKYITEWGVEDDDIRLFCETVIDIKDKQDQFKELK